MAAGRPGMDVEGELQPVGIPSDKREDGGRGRRI
jgi:hypothetical protein